LPTYCALYTVSIRSLFKNGSGFRTLNAERSHLEKMMYF